MDGECWDKIMKDAGEFEESEASQVLDEDWERHLREDRD